MFTRKIKFILWIKLHPLRRSAYKRYYAMRFNNRLAKVKVNKDISNTGECKRERKQHANYVAPGRSVRVSYIEGMEEQKFFSIHRTHSLIRRERDSKISSAGSERDFISGWPFISNTITHPGNVTFCCFLFIPFFFQASRDPQRLVVADSKDGTPLTIIPSSRQELFLIRMFLICYVLFCNFILSRC